MEKFKESVEFKGGYVSWPWKEKTPELPVNRELAIGRLTINRLKNKPNHAVVTPQKTTTQLRVVYDASAKTKKENNSLIDCLFRGPVMLHDLTGILMRFRMHRIALVADTEKAFFTNRPSQQPTRRDMFCMVEGYKQSICKQ